MNVIKLASMRGEPSDIEAEARAWVIRLDAGQPAGREAEAQRRELGEWLGRSPLHRQCFEQAAALWFDLDRIAGFVLEAERAQREPAECRYAHWPLVAFGSFLLALSLVGAEVWQRSGGFSGPAPASASFATAVGEIRSETLPDGSRLSLNTNTRVELRYRRDARVVELAAGEAYFEVARDAARPFVVQVGKYEVRAVGTAFSVQAADSAVGVIVTEGRIEVSAFESAEGAGEPQADPGRVLSLVPLEQGQMGVFNEEVGKLELVREIGQAQREKDLSWRNGMLTFDGDSLAAVVAEIGRYVPESIVIADPDLAELRFGGSFEVGDIDAILATLEQDFDIRVDRDGSDLIRLFRNP